YAVMEADDQVARLAPRIVCQPIKDKLREGTEGECAAVRKDEMGALAWPCCDLRANLQIDAGLHDTRRESRVGQHRRGGVDQGCDGQDDTDGMLHGGLQTGVTLQRGGREMVRCNSR